MGIEWSDQALSDLGRLYDFLSATNPNAAARMIDRLFAAPEGLLEQPRRGSVLEKYFPREVRRLISGNYELRYETRGTDIVIVGVFHTRENR